MYAFIFWERLPFQFSVLWKLILQELSDNLEKCVCQLCGYKNESSVDKVRFQILETEGIQDLSLLPPRESNLKYIMRVNYVANMYINVVRLNMCLEDPTEQG